MVNHIEHNPVRVSSATTVGAGAGIAGLLAAVAPDITPAAAASVATGFVGLVTWVVNEFVRSKVTPEAHLPKATTVGPLGSPASSRGAPAAPRRPGPLG